MSEGRRSWQEEHGNHQRNEELGEGNEQAAREF